MFTREDFPKVAIYRKPKNRIAFSTDFKDGEIVEFKYFHERPNSYEEGLAFYKGENLTTNLINIKDLEEIKI